MTARQCDIAILGGGLAGGLVALALARHRPDVSLLVIEQGERLGGNHVWSYFDSDTNTDAQALLAPLVVASWSGYSVSFPSFDRDLSSIYNTITSHRLDEVLRQTLPQGAILTGNAVSACSERSVTLADGTMIEAKAVIDCRGAVNFNDLTGGWQKFLGQKLKLSAPHGLTRPVVMDASVAQHDGYRFVYCLPFAEDEIFVEDTYYSDSAELDRSALSQRIADYAANRGWKVAHVIAEEHGVLPVVSGGDWQAFWQAGSGAATQAGARAGLFHAVTSYSVPDAVRFALALARQPVLEAAALHGFGKDWARQHWRSGRFLRALSAMLFGAADPDERYRVLERFYRLDQGLIERFYAGRSTLRDKIRILAGRPPVPVSRALGVLTGLGAKPRKLIYSGTQTI